MLAWHVVRPINIYHDTNGKSEVPSTSPHRILTSELVSGFADHIELLIVAFFMFHVTESCNFIQRLPSSKDIRGLHYPCRREKTGPSACLDLSCLSLSRWTG